MIEFKFNKKNIFPDIRIYLKILIASVIVTFVLKGLILNYFPIIETFNNFWGFMFWFAIIIYLKDLIEFKIGSKEWF